ncbi:MAG: hypothetical protein R2791_20790 [Saprospiraceae bacterium]|nr:hypothetical protein [Saprospiraceae bacterium]
MKLLPVFMLIALSLWQPGCSEPPPNPCVESLRQRDSILLARADSLLRLRDTLPGETYLSNLEQMRAEEQRLFLDVQECDFGKDLASYNYWYRGRLKFPGKLRQELYRLKPEMEER